MRLLLPVLVWIIFVGGLWSYIHQRELTQDRKQPAVSQEIKKTQKRVTLSLTPTFTAEKDPFALNLDNAAGDEILVRLNGNTLDTSPLSLERGSTVALTNLGNLTAGKNELYLEISPPLHDTKVAHALRVQLSDDNKELLDTTIWSRDGALLSGSFVFEIIDEVEHEH
jgi:hypothetical protein